MLYYVNVSIDNNGVNKFEHKCTGCEQIGEGSRFYCTTCMGRCRDHGDVVVQ